MRILLTGGTGFIGSLLLPALRERGHELLVLTRGEHADTDGCRFVRSLDAIPPTQRIDAVINLAGASLAERRWTAAYKREIVDSRLQTTRELVALCGRLEVAPTVLLSGSAIGYYGHHGDEPLTESADGTPGFARQLCSDWEALALQARDLGMRVCLLRLGVVLDSGGGALQQMSGSFRLGVGSWLGSGRQWLSWVHRRDVVRAIVFLLEGGGLQGPFNITAPDPVTGRAFCAALEKHHRTLFSAGVPGPLMRLLVGEMAGELLLNGQRVVPAALEAAGFRFDYPDIERALDAIYAG